MAQLIFTPAQETALQESRTVGLELAPRLLFNSLEFLGINMKACSHASLILGVAALRMLQNLTADEADALRNLAEQCTSLNALFNQSCARELGVESKSSVELFTAKGLCAVQQHWDQIKEIKASLAATPTTYHPPQSPVV